MAKGAPKLEEAREWLLARERPGICKRFRRSSPEQPHITVYHYHICH